MTPHHSSTSETRAPPLGTLLVGGDWACADGDVGTLAHVAGQLAERLDDELRAELLELVNRCHHVPDKAGAAWARLRELLAARARELPVERHDEPRLAAAARAADRRARAARSRCRAR